MTKFCGIAHAECKDFSLGRCGKEQCVGQIVIPNSRYGEIENAKFKYMGQILHNQQIIMNKLSEIQDKIK